MPALAALGTVIAGFVAAVVLGVLGHELIGIIVGLGCLPVALVVWMTVGDRYSGWTRASGSGTASSTGASMLQGNSIQRSVRRHAYSQRHSERGFS